MSKLVRKLHQVFKGASQPMGFRSGATSLSPLMLLIASLAQRDKLTEVASAEVDAILVGSEDVQHQALQQIADIPWGVWSKSLTPQSIKAIKEARGDFIVFEAATAPIALLQEKEIGKVLKISPPLGNSLIRTINRLPIDATLIDITAEEKITVSHSMCCQWLVDLVGKPLLVAVSQELTDSEVQALWESGVSGIIIEVEEGVKEKLLKLRQAIKALPPAIRQQESKEVILPPIEP